MAGLAGFVGESIITLLILFFVFRDGADFVNRVASLLPLDRERTDRLFSQIRQSVFANLYGILAVALAQGLLTSAAVAIVGVGSPLLLGIAAAVCSLIPFVGPTLVWLPVSNLPIRQRTLVEGDYFYSLGEQLQWVPLTTSSARWSLHGK